MSDDKYLDEARDEQEESYYLEKNHYTKVRRSRKTHRREKARKLREYRENRDKKSWLGRG